MREGWIARMHFAEASPGLWLESELVHLEDLVQHDFGMHGRAPARRHRGAEWAL
jgi:hypothetical protein